tara:strand:+ start:1070 stop:1792 length:723 start_codon:yes stop_codon:yes gene_type:complete
MNTVEEEMIKVLELVAFKYAKWEKHKLENNSDLPEISLYKDDFEEMGITYQAALLPLKQLEGKGMLMIDHISDPLTFDPEKDPFDEEDIVNGKLRVMVYNLIVGGSSVYRYLDGLKNGFEEDEYTNNSHEASFEEDESILNVAGYQIKIALQDKITNDHKILNYILNHDDEEVYYKDIAQNEFGEIAYGDKDTSWKRYHTSCKSINDKVREVTKGKINDFLIFNTGNKGRVRINGLYRHS